MGKRRKLRRRHRLLGLVGRGAGTVGVLALCVVLPWGLVRAGGPLPFDRFQAAPADPRPVVLAASVARDAADAIELAVGRPLPEPEFLVGPAEAAGAPVRIVVPQLDVDAPVVPISGQSGVLVPPSDPQSIGWWQEGRHPGDPAGSAVLTGHTVHTGGGALDDLGTLRRGDTFTVRTTAGEITYWVSWEHDYLTAELARQAAKLFGQDDFPRLLLITCSHWNGSEYDDSAVVLARPLAPRPARSGPDEALTPRPARWLTERD